MELNDPLDRDTRADDLDNESIADHESSLEQGDELQGSAFVRHLTRTVTSLTSDRSPRLQVEARGRLAKFWYGADASIHYEVALHERTSRLETGLHCEALAERNRALYRYFDRHMVEIQAVLGPAFWLEDWDRGWIRLYETVPLRPLYLSRVDEVAERLLEVIHTLQPLLDAAHL